MTAALVSLAWVVMDFLWWLNKPLWRMACALHLEVRYGWPPEHAWPYTESLLELADEARDEWGCFWFSPADAVEVDAEYWDG
jgi:hypothetical protein